MLDKQDDKFKKVANQQRKVFDQNAKESEKSSGSDSEDSWGGEDVKGHRKQLLQFRVNKQKKSPKQSVQLDREKRKKTELEEDFMTFDDVNENAFVAKTGSGGSDKGKKDGLETDSELENKINKRFDKSRYPWLSKKTLKIKDIFLFLHSEILDFVEFVS